MIMRDSDLAANLLIEKLGIVPIRQRIHALGGDGMDLVAGFGDSKASAQGLKNLTSARALLVLLWGLAKDQVVSADASKQMLGLIARSGLQADIAGAVPLLTRGPRRSVGGDHHDATIIIGAHSFVLVTVVRGLADPRATAALVARIAHAVAHAM
jgi:beta-lactamase class A